MNIPGFTAESSVYKTTGNYFKSRQDSVVNPGMFMMYLLSMSAAIFPKAHPIPHELPLWRHVLIYRYRCQLQHHSRMSIPAALYVEE